MSNVILKQVTIKNFLSFGNAPVTINLDTQLTTGIVGINKDIGEEGGSRNGAGKTSAFNAVVYALYGEGIDKIPADGMINIINEREMSVTLVMLVDGIEYTVIRARKPNSLTLLRGDEDITLDSMTNTSKLIVDLLHRDYDVFMMENFLNPHREGFVAKKPADQRATIENILDLHILSERAEVLRKDVRKNEQVRLEVLENECKTYKTQLEHSTSLVDGYKSEIESNKQMNERSLEVELQFQATVKDINIREMGRSEDKFNKLGEVVSVLIDQTNEYVSLINDNDDLLSEYECKYKQEQLTSIVETTVEEYDKYINDYETTTNLFNDLNSKISNNNQVLVALEQIKRLRLSYENDKLNKLKTVDDITQRLSVSLKELDEHTLSTDELHKELELVKQINELSNAIMQTENELTKVTYKLESGIKELDTLEQQKKECDTGVCGRCGTVGVLFDDTQSHEYGDKIEAQMKAVTDLNDSYTHLENQLTTLISDHDKAVSERVSDLEQNDIVWKIRNITVLTEEIEQYDAQLDVLSKNLADIDTQLNSKELEYDESKTEAVANEIESMEKELSDVDAKLQKMNDSVYKSMDRTLIEKKHERIAEINDKLSELKLNQVNLDTEYKRLNDDLTNANKEYNELEQNLKSIHDLLRDKHNIVIKDSDELQSLLNTSQSKSETLKGMIENDPTTTIMNAENNRMMEWDRLLKDAEEKIDQCNKKLEHIKFLIMLLTDNKSFIRKRILDVYLPIINRELLTNTDRLGLPHLCTINSDLSVDIEYMGKNVSYYNLSRGERLRLELATMIALRKVMMVLGKKSNILLVDEFLDSALDTSGITAANKLIGEVAESVFLITHRMDLLDDIENVMTIQKQNGFSTIV